ncbi:MAG: hypothetical protein NTW25_01685 [Candidatus Kapabacteria bacterium]|nr:hypothetical protein [Candidatus Kapabacteria bacterium]
MMKNIYKAEILMNFRSILFLILISLNSIVFAQTEQVVIGTATGNSSAVLHLGIDGLSVPKGFLPPRMSTTQRDAIASPANALIVFNTTTNEYNYNSGADGVHSWVTLLNTALVGDATVSSGTITLANTGISSGTFGSNSLIPIIAVDTKGRLTYAGSTTFSSISSNLTNASIYVGNGSNVATAVAVSGDVTLSNLGAISLTVTGVSSGTYGSVSQIPILAVDTKGRVTYAGSTTFASLSPTLNSTNIYVGNASNVATGVALTGDATLNNSGSFSLVNTGVSSGTFGSITQIPIIAVDSKGRLTYAGSTTYSTGSATITLEQAYNAGGSGNGKSITVGSGAVNLVGTNTSDYTLRISNSAAGGGLFINNTSTGNSLAVTNNSSTYMLIDNSGKVALGSIAANEVLTMDGALSLKKMTAPSNTSLFGKIYVNTTDAKLYFTDESGNKSMLSKEYAIFQEEQNVGVDAGSFFSGGWTERTLNNTQSLYGSSISLSGSTFTLTAGTYKILAFAIAYKVNGHQIKLFNKTDNSDDLIGSSAYSGSADDVNTSSNIEGVLTISGTKDFVIQHRCTTSRASDGKGKASNVVKEYYTRVYIEKLR